MTSSKSIIEPEENGTSVLFFTNDYIHGVNILKRLKLFEYILSYPSTPYSIIYLRQ